MRWLKSVRHALRGFKEVFKVEGNFRIEVVIALLIAVISFVLPLASFERAMVILVIASVLVLELLNSAVERMVDTLSPRIDVLAGVVKDILAAAVFLMSIVAVIIGVAIFYPYIIKWHKMIKIRNSKNGFKHL